MDGDKIEIIYISTVKDNKNMFDIIYLCTKCVCLTLLSFSYYYCITHVDKYHTISEFNQHNPYVYKLFVITVNMMFFLSIFSKLVEFRDDYYSMISSFGAMLTLVKLNTSKFIHVIGAQLLTLTPIIQHYHNNHILSKSLSILTVVFIFTINTTNTNRMKNLTLSIEFLLIALIVAYG